MDVKKVANELSGPFAKVGAPQADNDSSNAPEKKLGRMLLSLSACGAPTLAKGPDSSYATLLTSETHTILIVIIINLCFVISRIVSL